MLPCYNQRVVTLPVHTGCRWYRSRVNIGKSKVRRHYSHPVIRLCSGWYERKRRSNCMGIKMERSIGTNPEIGRVIPVIMERNSDRKRTNISIISKTGNIYNTGTSTDVNPVINGTGSIEVISPYVSICIGATGSLCVYQTWNQKHREK